MDPLDPDLARVIHAVSAWRGRAVRAEILGGGITNRNWRVEVGGSAFVVRLAGRDTALLGVDRDAERAATEAAHDAGTAPEIVAFLPEHEALITRFVEADPIPAEDLERPEVMAAVVRSVKAIHSMAPIPSRFDVFDVVRRYRATAAERGIAIPPAYDEALTAADRIAATFAARPRPLRPCHNDLLNANLLMAGDRVVIVDYEYAGMGDPFFDLGNFSINNGISERAQEGLLQRYFGDVRAMHRARLRLAMILSDFREAMWGVVQQAISSLQFDYVAYAERHFSRCLANAGDERFGAWLRDAVADEDARAVDPSRHAEGTTAAPRGGG
ncbi:MAG TPA: choline/ethanolamine kinase family protein [Actinomycetota bacterium]|nr:choline/ethanolamine kinase family protein [Actinomycetota bacterium]